MIPIIDLKAQQTRIRELLDKRVKAVLDHGLYVLGPEVLELEKVLGQHYNAHCLGVSDGTEALVMLMRAWGIGPGDAVFVPDFTFVATAESVVLLGAIPVFVDVEQDTFNLSPHALEIAIEKLKKQHPELTPKAVIAVDLFGQLADYPAISEITKQHDLHLLSDNAQGFGASFEGKFATHYADGVTTSFFPAKPLGCYGDGGAIFVKDNEVLSVLESIRVHGQGEHKYDNVRVGTNGRLDTLQAAVLLAKWSIFLDEIKEREVVACRYQQALKGCFEMQRCDSGHQSVWAQFTLRHKNRSAALAALHEAGIASAIYYVNPLSTQPPYRSYPKGDNVITHTLVKEVFSVPMHPYLDEELQSRIIDIIKTSVL